MRPLLALLTALALTACSKAHEQPAPNTNAPSEAGSKAPSPNKPDTEHHASAEESCVDKWLQAHDLDQYGQKRGTMYMGGSPLFDERTGVTTSRLDYVYQQQPAAREACGGSKR